MAVDHGKKKVVISIRGTLSPKVNFSEILLSLQFNTSKSVTVYAVFFCPTAISILVVTVKYHIPNMNEE